MSNNNNNFSVVYFSIFTPHIFQSKIKNQFIKLKVPKKNFYNFKTANSVLIKKIKTNSYDNIKPLFCKTSNNTGNFLSFRDFMTVKSNKSNNNKKKKNKTKYRLTHNIGRPGSAEPYKQYILEKREIEENRKRREIEKKYIIESKKNQELKLLNDIKTKNEGYDFSRQEKKVGFMEKHIESKNYSKEKTKNSYERTSINYRKNNYNYQYVDMELLEDIKTNKRKNIFEEDFDLKTSTKYNSFRLQAASFIKSLRHNPNYNYWIRKDQ